MNPELSQFVRDSLLKGLSREKIQTALEDAGWQEDEIKAGLGAFHEKEFPVPVPSHRPYLSAKEAYMYLLMFLTLYISAVSLGTLLFQYINHWVPDPTAPGAFYSGYDASLNKIRSATAALLISFPIFLYVASTLRKAVMKYADKRTSKIRKWLTYITLFIAAGIIIGDLIAALFSLLNGDLTLRFGLKVSVILMITGFIFGYYLLSLRREEK
jgi:hypothetical protein